MKNCRNFWHVAKISTIGFLGSKYDFFSHIWHYYGKEILPVKSVDTVRALESAGDVYFRCIDISRRFEHLESREISNTKHDLFRRNTGLKFCRTSKSFVHNSFSTATANPLLQSCNEQSAWNVTKIKQASNLLLNLWKNISKNYFDKIKSVTFFFTNCLLA